MQQQWKANKRIENEIRDLVNWPDSPFKVFKDFNPYKYSMKFTGPEGSPYENIHITIDFIYPRSYPFNPPVLWFQPPLFHPNITAAGALVVDTLTGNDWSPAITTTMILLNVLTLLYEPFFCEENLKRNDKGKEEMNQIVNDKCVNMEALNLWENDIEQFKLIIALNAE